ncbi:phospholipid methyltransferase [Flagelloscypha sp. PMI_526]|nr:phospholipid methyltransferase [Flagelloscypha sp. PMI_526]
MTFTTSALTQYIDFNDKNLQLALAAIVFNPTAWNIVARNEYRNKTITRIFGGNAYYGTYFLAACIFSAGMFRDSLYRAALQSQPQVELLPEPLDIVLPVMLFFVGQIFVITSTWSLGITGTFLGDYFGILMDHRVEGQLTLFRDHRFPFNVLRDPMYDGSTMSFLATALWYNSPAGLFVTLFVYIVYQIALRFEGPFTDMIYSNRASQKKD